MLSKRAMRLFSETFDEIEPRTRRKIAAGLGNVREPRSDKWTNEEIGELPGKARPIRGHTHDLELNWPVLRPLPETEASYQIALLLAEIFIAQHGDGTTSRPLTDTAEGLAEAWGFEAPE